MSLSAAPFALGGSGGLRGTAALRLAAASTIDQGPLTLSSICAALHGCCYSVFLLQQLQSIASQTVPPGGTAVCDGVSSDSTLDILTESASLAGLSVRRAVNKEPSGAARDFEMANLRQRLGRP